MKFRQYLTLAAGFLLIAAGIAIAADLSTSGRCTRGTSCNIGDSATASFTLTTDGADLDLDGTGNALTVTATTTATAVFTGADAAGASNTTYDTTGAGAVQVGSADVTGVTVVTDGGTATIDGYVQGDVPFLVITTAASLTANTVHIATTDDATHVMPACVAANLGEWVTVIVGDPSENVSLSLVDASNRFVVSGVDTSAAAHELDSPTAAATSGGASVTLTCLVAEFWHSTAITGVWLDGN